MNKLSRNIRGLGNGWKKVGLWYLFGKEAHFSWDIRDEDEMSKYFFVFGWYLIDLGIRIFSKEWVYCNDHYLAVEDLGCMEWNMRRMSPASLVSAKHRPGLHQGARHYSLAMDIVRGERREKVWMSVVIGWFVFIYLF